MTSNEFLKILEDSLVGDLPRNEINSNLSYYRDYIDSQRGIKTEEEIVGQLGDPRLIARTIIDTYHLSHDSRHYEGGQEQNSYRQTSSNQYEDVRQTNDTYQGYDNRHHHSNIRIFNMPGWLAGVLAIVIFAAVFGIVFFIGGVVLKLFFRFFIPIICILIGVSLLRNLFRR